jgi:UDP-N-acetylglucosamine 3-dehydrogenase
MNTVGVGIVGCGFVGRGAHVPAFGSIEGAQLVAVADADAKRLGKVQKKYPLKTAYQDYAELVKDPDIQAVVVSLPTPLHANASMAAIAAGKHVLCEMPLAANLEEADQLIEAAQKAGVILMPSLNFRFTPNYVKAKAMIEQGVVGKPACAIYREFISAKDLADQWPPSSWMWKLQESGGPLYTLCVWSIDLLRWLFQTDITEVHSAVKYSPLSQFGGTLGYDASATVRLANGMVGSLQYSGNVTRSSSTSRLEVVGDSNTLIDATWNDTLTVFGDEPAKSEWKVGEPGARMWGHYQMDEYFVRCIQQGQAPSITPQDGRRAMEIGLQIVQAANRSA